MPSDLVLYWWAQQDSNLRHADYESVNLVFSQVITNCSDLLLMCLKSFVHAGFSDFPLLQV